MNVTIFFSGTPLDQVLKNRKIELRKEIEGYQAGYILKTDEQELCDSLVAKYSKKVPTLQKEALTAKQPEDGHESGFAGTFDVTRYTIIIPFTGDSDLFSYRPSHFTFNPPRGNIEGNKLYLYYSLPAGATNLKQSIDGDVESIEGFLSWVQHDVDEFNDSLKTLVTDLVTQKRQILKRGETLLNDLGIPIHSRQNLPEPYTDLSKREPVEIKHRPIKIKDALPKEEPFIPAQSYEHILNVIFNMSVGMERSPEFFSKQPEERLRDFILMFLNIYFEGQATGETFNKEGKTDILIRVENKNAFIAECKFWNGKKEFIETIEQLFKYVTWRDTKTAILLFNRNKNFKAVLQQIERTVALHPCCVAKHHLNREKLRDETVFSYIFHYPDDKDREILLTVLCFDVEQPKSEA